jgi:hypothetical protein
LFPLLATGVVDTGGKLPPVSLTLAANFLLAFFIPVANLPPVTTTLAKLVAKFAACVLDTDGGCTLTCEYLRKFSGKFETVLMGYSGAGGKLIHEKNQTQKIS